MAAVIILTFRCLPDKVSNSLFHPANDIRQCDTGKHNCICERKGLAFIFPESIIAIDYKT